MWYARKLMFVSLVVLFIGVASVSTAADDAKTFDGRISRVEGSQITLLVGKDAMTFEITDTTMIELDGTPITADQLTKAQFASIQSTEQEGMNVAQKILARTTLAPLSD